MKFLYNEQPNANKINSEGIFLEPHEKCGGRCICTYEEDSNYKIHCEICGELDNIRASSKDDAMEEWKIIQIGGITNGNI